jgi:hypothetical protein
MNDLADTVLQRWPSFRDKFFAAPNGLRLDSGIAALDRLIATAGELLTTEPAGPIMLPALVGRTTHYFAMAFTAEQARTMRELLQSHIGTTWTDFDGQSVHGRARDDPLERAAVTFAGDSRHVYRFRVADAARNVVRDSIQTLLESIMSAPRRQARISLPIGRLIGDLTDACAAGAEEAAREAYLILAADHRVSATSRLFLQVQVLAAFERWEDLEAHPALDTLLKLSRPTPASDALAHLAMSKLPDSPDLDTFGPVATRFNALIDSVSAIRSTAGARYYTLWAIAAGEPPETLGQRLTAAGWSNDPTILTLLGTVSIQAVDSPTLSIAELRRGAKESIEAGRFDTAVGTLSKLPTDSVDLPAVLEAVSHTLTAEAIALLERHRAHHGDEAMRRAVSPASPLESQIDPATLPQRLVDLFSTSIDRHRLAEHVASIEHTGLAEIRVPGGTDATCQTIRAVTSGDGPERLSPGIDLCIDLVRDLKASDAAVEDVRSLSHSVLELWAYHDNTGDRRRVARIVQLAGDLVEIGLGVQAFDEVVELVRAGWDPFLTDTDLPIGLDLLEQLIAYRADDTHSLDKFAVPMLSRIGPHNASRIPSAALAVAIDIAPSFGLTVEIPQPEAAEALVTAMVRAGTKVALYSLQEHALDRAAKILRERHPALEVFMSSDHVATEALRSVARTADLLVIMDRAATHAATSVLKAERPTAPIRYAAGKGSTSMIEAAEAWLREKATPPMDRDTL